MSYFKAITQDVKADGDINSGTLIWATGAMDTRTAFTALDFFDVPFNDGLTVDVFDAAGSVLVVYE